MKLYIITRDTHHIPTDISDKEIISFVKEATQELKKRLKRIMPDIGLIFVSRSEIQKLNKKYRNIDKPTDVLSFTAEEEGYLGDIIISKEVVMQYADTFHCTFQEELKRDILHGIMHLVGYDHNFDLHEGSEEEMFLIQEAILKHIT